MTQPDPAALIFDLDGTLFDTLEDLADSMNAVLTEHNFPEHPLDPYRFFVGTGAKALVRRALPEERRNDEVLVEECRLAFSNEYNSRWHAKSQLYQGISAMLGSLVQRAMPMAILSNKPQAFVDLIADRFLARWSFQSIRGERDGIPRKPSPQASLAIATELQVDPTRCWHLGDTNTDMETALAAGMTPVGVLWGFRPREELLESGAKIILEHPDDLMKHLSS